MSNSAKIDQNNEIDKFTFNSFITRVFMKVANRLQRMKVTLSPRTIMDNHSSERGDVPGWVLVVLMTTGLVTAIWTIAAPRLSSILRNSLDAMNAVR